MLNEAIEIEKCSNSFIGEDGWKPVIDQLKT